MNQKLTPPKNVSKMTPAEGRFACYWWSLIQNGTAFTEREEEARAACDMAEGKYNSEREKQKTIEKELEEDSKRRIKDSKQMRETGHDAKAAEWMSNAEREAKEEELRRISNVCVPWQNGELIRRQCIRDEELAANVAKHHGKDDAVIKTPVGVDVEELLWGASDHVRDRFKLTNGYMPMIDDSLFRQCAEVARLAVELARLEWVKYKKPENAIPNDQLRNAAELIQRSAAFIAVHPQREQTDAAIRFMDKAEGGRVQISEIVGPKAKGVTVQRPDGTRFSFRRYDDNTTMKGFVALVRQHLQRLNPDVDEDGVQAVVNEWKVDGIPHLDMMALAESRKLANLDKGGGTSNVRRRKEQGQKKPKAGRK